MNKNEGKGNKQGNKSFEKAAKTAKGHNTVYDDVFRTIVERMPWLLIPVINEVFHTNYSEDEEVIVLHNEHHCAGGEVITDSCLQIGSKIYHIECQSKEDIHMEIRMIEYDFLIALENAKKSKKGYIVMELPKSCTLYLRHTKRTPDFLKVQLRIPTEAGITDVVYATPIAKVQSFSKEYIFRKRLIALLPFYIMRYEKQRKMLNENKEKLEELLQEYESIVRLLDRELAGADNAAACVDLKSLIIRISDFFLRSYGEVKEGVAQVMGGKVLELESERLLAKGKVEGTLETLISLAKDGLLEISEAAKRAGMPVQEFKKLL